MNGSVSFTCVVSGHPLVSVIITGPDGNNALYLNCFTPSSSKRASCKLASREKNRASYLVEVKNVSYGGKYKCAAETRWQRFSQGVDGISSLETVGKESKAEIELNFSKSTDEIEVSCLIIFSRNFFSLYSSK